MQKLLTFIQKSLTFDFVWQKGTHIYTSLVTNNQALLNKKK